MFTKNSYEPLMPCNNMNMFKITVTSLPTNNFDGKCFIYVGPAKNKRSHVFEFESGKRSQSNQFEFSYTDPKRSSICLTMVNRKSFWSDDRKLGETELLISDFSTAKPEVKEIQLSNNGPKVLIRTQRVEMY
ncbi:hypothetical protein TVAG_425550 [Trichomonas vaginalis G3]|uniref:Uncharacterized protein n=1 Tax=Trichomonas vaginalis (strain ATCC PRA-98 / G3) TaxID=412133 RepID=A2FI89_TRIV3|nr:hypothetical protein TVAGG3_0723280 [Trichomonas vaginalis G3]EAX95371.1 hypothetical protein TVAG_425550 [Trichomonas vaginalis G3]KAI5510739.1 hypothetical protein TVAGG3_0723280 [Trichomonas vaginalis G3]|eukprot:XP_001308301.1 hypothetical protein [Trichomonas vaginalis G3]